MYSNFVSNYMQDFSSFGHSSLEFVSQSKNDSKTVKTKDEVLVEQNSVISPNKVENTSPPQSESDASDTETRETQETHEAGDLKPGPFIRDTCAVSEVVGDVVLAVSSAGTAVEIIKNDTKTSLNFQCPYCHIIIRHPKRYLIHYKWHSFGLTNEMRMAAARETEVMRTARRKELKLERLLKQEAKGDSKTNYPCRDCDKAFINVSSLERHRASVHPKKDPITECKICNTPVKGLSELRVHMAVHMTKDTNVVQRYQCPECPKRYKFPHSLVKHMDTHLDKTHPCSVCSKLFGSPAQLHRHMKLHEKVAKGANFHCAYCGKSYYDAFTLQIHERNHTQEKPFSCDICKTSYSTNSSLQRHLKVSHHSASKPFICEFCKRCFSLESTRKRHIMREHADPSLRPYACTICEGRYFKPKDLRNHMYKVHPDARNSCSEGD